MNRINILYLHETSRIAGAENSLINLVKNIDRSKFIPAFVLPEEGALVSELRKLDMGLSLIKFPKIRKGLGVLRTIQRLRRVIKERDIDIVHSNSIRTHIYGSLAGRLERRHVVWHERNLITTETVDMDRLFFFLPDKIICISQAVANRFLKKGNLPVKVQVIHNGVALEEFNPAIAGTRIREEFGIGQDEVVLGITSRFHPGKGHETFFQAAKILISDHAPRLRCRVRFLVVGSAVFDEDRCMEKGIRALVESLGIKERVIFTGFRTDMPEVYAAMDIFVLPSQAEPFGRVTIEAMAVGKAVVATHTGGTREVVVDGVTGILVPPRNPHLLARALIRLVKDKEMASKMGRAGRERVENFFSITRNVKDIEKVYTDLVERG